MRDNSTKPGTGRKGRVLVFPQARLAKTGPIVYVRSVPVRA
jgi:hypothetical protein